MVNKKSALSILAALIFLAMLAAPALAAVGDTSLASVSTGGGVGNDASYSGVITPDGRYVAFNSSASNLITSDGNGYRDIFRRDLTNGTNILVSVDSSGNQGNQYSMNPAISSNGRYVAFISAATNLSGITDSNVFTDIFVRDITGSTTRAVSLDTTRTGFANGNSFKPTISDDGNLVAYESLASNLVSGDTNGNVDIFVDNGSSNQRVSISTAGDQGNGISASASISGNGRYVAFSSSSTNLVPNDTNARGDIFVRDMTLGTTTRVSVSSSSIQGDGGSSNPVISADGRYVAFVSSATNLVSGDTNGQTDVFVHDTQTGTTTRVSVASNGIQPNSWSDYPFISPDGRFIGFPSWASNLVEGDTNGVWDVFQHDMITGLTTRISVGTGGVQGNANSNGGSFSTNATYAVFTSYATNLVAGLSDSNVAADVFLREPDITPPVVTFGAGSIPAAINAYISTPPSELTVRFSENVVSDGTSNAANSLNNYMLVRPGPNGVFDTTVTAVGICDGDHFPDGDDVRVFISSVSYDSQSQMATLHFDLGDIPLALGQYRLYVCGAASINDLNGLELNGGTNTGIAFTVGAAPGGGGGRSTSTSDIPSAYPATGFAPGRLTDRPSQAFIYSKVGDMNLEIPALGIKLPVVEVPQTKDNWDISWLGGAAGWLSGSAFPTWDGNSVLTGHVYDANGQPGPFVNLGTLKWGDRIVIHAWDQDYVYEVRTVNDMVTPTDTRFLTKHEELPWLTLVTCKGYDEKSDTYRWRTVVRAVQIEVK